MGKEFRRRFKDHEHATNAYLLDTLKRLSGQNIVDTGAHVGDTGIFLAQELKNMGRTDIKVVMIEPHHEKVAFIRQLISLNGLDKIARVVQCAVGKVSGRTDIDTSDPNPGAWRVKNNGSGKVPIRPLDDIVDNVGLIHLDVEGQELDALQGGKSILYRDRPIIVLEAIHSDVKKIRSYLGGFEYRMERELPPYDIAFVPDRS